MTDIHAGDAVTLSSDAPDRPVELLADPTSTEVAVDLYFAIDGSKQTCAGCCTGRPANSHHRPSLRKKQPLSTQGLRNCGPTWSTRRIGRNNIQEVPRWPESIILSFPDTMRKSCVNNAGRRRD
jgi:hypothetical protein